MNWFSCIFNGERTTQEHAALNIEGIDNVKKYSYEELRNATGDFSPDNIVGQGGLASVYKGKLKDGTVVALKVLSNESIRESECILTELKVIHGIAHENLIRLHGCCIEDDHIILIYHYFVNGNLAEALLGENRHNIQFSWRRRSRVCIGIARGLAFLHEEVQPHIIHGDIKARNILLDRDLTPKLSGFDLAKSLPEDESYVSTDVAGTIGYIAPEYASTGLARRSSDVYSFGVLLLEIVTGRRNIVMRLYEEQFIRESVIIQVCTLYERGELSEILDTSVIDESDTEEACKFLKIGLLCIQANFHLRPTMSTVLQMLTGERDVESESITIDRDFVSRYELGQTFIYEVSSEASDEVFTEGR